MTTFWKDIFRYLFAYLLNENVIKLIEIIF